MEKRDLLIEIGTEELPPKALKSLSSAFSTGIEVGLKKSGIEFNESQSFATPRRLAILIADVSSSQPDQSIEKKGPALKVAYDSDGNPTKALIGFAKSCKTEHTKLTQVDTPKGVWLVHRTESKGQSLAEILPAIIQSSLDGLPIPKRMRWGNLTSEFVRPVHWLTILYGDQVIEAEILNQRSGSSTYGHRFHHPELIPLSSAESYSNLLESQGKVIASYETRKSLIRQQLLDLAKSKNATVIIDESLLDEVTNLVEWPVAILGSFDSSFLQVPAECLISAMKGHQKYFHLLDKNNLLLPNFISVSNIVSKNPAMVVSGNERVIRPRLSDAVFFWDQDRKKPLLDHLTDLNRVVFQHKLGTIAQKVSRVELLALHIAKKLSVDKEKVSLCCRLSKCDLLTNMVGEFPDLQGTMGRYYALDQGIDLEVAIAIDQAYQPRNAQDNLPDSSIAQVVAIADRLDTILGIFSIGLKPTGTKDPFALRRAAIAVLKIIITKGLDLDLQELLLFAAEGLKEQFIRDDIDQKLIDNLENHKSIFITLDYIFERVIAIYLDQGFTSSSIESVLAVRPTNPLDMNARLQAVKAFLDMDESESLSAANKRIGNILKKQDEPIPEHFDESLFNLSAESNLANAISDLSNKTKPLVTNREYTQSLIVLTQLEPIINSFFDEVMVMDKDRDIRLNRLALLKQVSKQFLQTADFSLI